jgi:hypothetical protein
MCGDTTKKHRTTQLRESLDINISSCVKVKEYMTTIPPLPTNANELVWKYLLTRQAPFQT